MNTSFHNLLLLDQTLFSRRLYHQLSGTGLTSGQPKILEYLLKHDGVIQKEIASACHIEPASVTSLLRRMEEDALIERKILNGNRRSLYVYLTPKGKTMALHVIEALDQLEEQILSSFTETERRTIIDSLYTIYQNLTKEDNACEDVSQ